MLFRSYKNIYNGILSDLNEVKDEFKRNISWLFDQVREVWPLRRQENPLVSEICNVERNRAYDVEGKKMHIKPCDNLTSSSTATVKATETDEVCFNVTSNRKEDQCMKVFAPNRKVPVTLTNGWISFNIECTFDTGCSISMINTKLLEEQIGRAHV